MFHELEIREKKSDQILLFDPLYISVAINLVNKSECHLQLDDTHGRNPNEVPSKLMTSAFNFKWIRRVRSTDRKTNDQI